MRRCCGEDFEGEGEFEEKKRARAYLSKITRMASIMNRTVSPDTKSLLSALPIGIIDHDDQIRSWERIVISRTDRPIDAHDAHFPSFLWLPISPHTTPSSQSPINSAFSPHECLRPASMPPPTTQGAYERDEGRRL
jgi:hypothetical protein